MQFSHILLFLSASTLTLASPSYKAGHSEFTIDVKVNSEAGAAPAPYYVMKALTGNGTSILSPPKNPFRSHQLQTRLISKTAALPPRTASTCRVGRLIA
jgi:hypothetical protein